MADSKDQSGFSLRIRPKTSHIVLFETANLHEILKSFALSSCLLAPLCHAHVSIQKPRYQFPLYPILYKKTPSLVPESPVQSKFRTKKEKMPFSQSFSFFKPFCFWVVLALILSQNANAESEEQSFGGLGPFLKRNHRETIISTEFGEVSEAKVTDGNESFQLHFITLEPNSLFLPVFLNLDMVFYVHTGIFTNSWWSS